MFKSLKQKHFLQNVIFRCVPLKAPKIFYTDLVEPKSIVGLYTFGIPTINCCFSIYSVNLEKIFVVFSVK